MVEGTKQVNKLGCGLGLNISNKLAKKLGEAPHEVGLQVESVWQSGSTFHLTIEDK